MKTTTETQTPHSQDQSPEISACAEVNIALQRHAENMGACRFAWMWETVSKLMLGGLTVIMSWINPQKESKQRQSLCAWLTTCINTRPGGETSMEGVTLLFQPLPKLYFPFSDDLQAALIQLSAFFLLFVSPYFGGLEFQPLVLISKKNVCIS